MADGNIVVDKLHNWKSTGAFFIFIGAYLYIVATGGSASTLDATGTIALYSSLFMMVRSTSAVKLAEKLVDKLGSK